MTLTQSAVPVIIPMYNAESTIRACVNSLLQQRHLPVDLQIVVVDNNSSDGSCEAVSSINDRRITLLHEPRQGAYCARNTGLKETDSDIVLFTDPDCIADPLWVSEILRPINEGPAGAALGRVVPQGNSGLLKAHSLYEMNKELFIFSGQSPGMMFGRTNNMAIRRHLLVEQGLFEENARGGDTRFVQHAVTRHGPEIIAYVPTARVVHTEITRFNDHLRKTAIYAGTTGSGAYALDVPTRRHKWRLLRQTCRSSTKPVRTGMALLAALGLEARAWRKGKRG